MGALYKLMLVLVIEEYGVEHKEEDPESTGLEPALRTS
jgi:hypothetical protein